MKRQMADRISKDIRSRNMSRIRGKDTSIEIKVRKYLFGQGFRYRKNVKDLPGKPDIVLPKYRTAIFINGCFWHHHGCKLALYPKTNSDFWLTKINKNVDNDKRNQEMLLSAGYQVITIWECDIEKRFDETMKNVIDFLTKCKEEAIH